MKLRARAANYALQESIMLIDEHGHNAGVLRVEVIADEPYLRKFTDALVEHINATEFDVELPPRLT